MTHGSLVGRLFRAGGRGLSRLVKSRFVPALHRVGAVSAARICLCAGTQRIPGYVHVDVELTADLIIDLAVHGLPFRDGTADVVVCTSAINYFTSERGGELVSEAFRVLKRGGVARFSTQDLALFARRYADDDHAFFDEKLADGAPRYPGPTLADRFGSILYGFPTAGGPVRYAYDFDALAHRFRAAGFATVERRDYLSSRLPEIALVDNRCEQMFFLEAVK